MGCPSPITAAAVTKRFLLLGSRDWYDSESIVVQLRHAREYLGENEHILMITGPRSRMVEEAEEVWSEPGYMISRDYPLGFRVDIDLCIVFIKEGAYDEEKLQSFARFMRGSGIETWRIIG